MKGAMLSGFLFWWLAVLVLASLLGWQVWRARHFRAAAEMREAALIADNATLSEAASRAEAKARQLDGVLAALSDGVSVVDAELRLVGWNPRFAECAGVPRRALRIGMPMAEVLRLQAEAGEFGLVDPEAEVAQRMALLRGGFFVPRVRRERPDGSTVELRRAALPEGGFVTVYSPVMSTPAPHYQPDLAAAFDADWRSRIPRLCAVAAEGDAPAVRALSHALRGIAANAGWTALAMTLGLVETAAEDGDLAKVSALVALLPLDPPA